MKNIFPTAILCAVLMISCKKEIQKEATSDNENLETSTMNLEKDINFSLAQWSFHVPIQKGLMDPMDFAERSKALGFDVIEYVDQLYVLDPTLSYQEGVMKLALSWKEKNDEFGVSPGLIMIDRAGELCDPSEEKRMEAIKNHKYWIDAAAAIGSPALRVNLFGLTDPEPWHEASVIALKELGMYAAEKNILILPENHAQLSNDVDLMVSVIKEVNMPSVGVLPDFGNFCVKREGGERWGPAKCVEQYDPYDGIAKLTGQARGFISAKSHDFDENGDEIGVEGHEAAIDYYKMIQILKDAGFSGYIGVEYENEEHLDPSKGILATKNLILKAYKKAN